MEDRKILLTDAERGFCELFVDGDKEFAGKAESCYKEVFGETHKNIGLAARRLIGKEHIAAYIKELVVQRDVETETIAVKLQVAETLKSVMSETSKGEYVDKFGVPLSPASLRAVSVNAAKALMEIYPIKNSQNQNCKTGENSGNIIFNVIVPQNASTHEDEDQL